MHKVGFQISYGLGSQKIVATQVRGKHLPIQGRRGTASIAVKIGGVPRSVWDRGCNEAEEVQRSGFD